MKESKEHRLSSINEMWMHTVNHYSTKPALGLRQSETITLPNGKITESASFHSLTYGEVEEEIVTLGCALIELGFQPGQGAALIAENSRRWLTVDMALLGNGGYDIPRGVSSTDRELIFILNHSRCEMAFLENAQVLHRMHAVSRELEYTKTFVVLDRNFEEIDPEKGLFSYDYLLTLGKGSNRSDEFQKRRRNTKEEDRATLMYTSGTTGIPKGIPLKHGNIMHNVRHIPTLLHVDSSDRFLSILPIWHVFERTLEYMVLSVGASLWYTDKLTILKDLLLVNPTYLVSVPRIWISVYSGVKRMLRQKGKEELFNKLYRHSLNVTRAKRFKQNRLCLSIDETPEEPRASFLDHLLHFAADKLIYSKVRAKLGSSFKAGVSGGGSLPVYIDDFFETIGVTLLEGYGLTETSPVLCCRTFDNRIPYTVGIPVPETEIQIRDETGLTVEDSSMGTLWVSGPQVMEGYYNNKEETDRVMETDSQGKKWFNTGDLVIRRKTGDLSIIGRIKDTIVLIGGENLEPVPLEAVLLESEAIDQVMICGQDQETLTALIVPEEDRLKQLCLEKNIRFDKDNIPSLSSNPEIHSAFKKIIDEKISVKNGFKEIETIVNFAFTLPFSTEDETLTHTFKVKRNQVMKRDGKLIRSLYKNYHEKGKEKGGLS